MLLFHNRDLLQNLLHQTNPYTLKEFQNFKTSLTYVRQELFSTWLLRECHWLIVESYTIRRWIAKMCAMCPFLNTFFEICLHKKVTEQNSKIYLHFPHFITDLLTVDENVCFY